MLSTLSDETTAEPNRAVTIRAVAILLFVTWVGVNATWGLLSPGRTLVSAWLESVFSLGLWITLCVSLLLVAVITATWQRASGLGTVALLLVGYLAVLPP